jgi:hypothetical protein
MKRAFPFIGHGLPRPRYGACVVATVEDLVGNPVAIARALIAA